jgi:hypothetical protein
MRHVLASVVCLHLLSTFAPAQRVTGEIVGTVRDPSESVIPGARVTLTHEATNASRTVSTDAMGFYRAPTLDIGRYSIEVSAPGFKTAVRRGVELRVNEVLRVDFQMEVGSVTEQLTVEAAAPIVATETGEVSHIVGSREVVNLPLNGRIFIQLGMINPGVNQKAY